DVIYEAAEQGRDVTVVLNPDFSPEQMQLILDVLERLEMDNQAAVKRELEHLTTQVMSLDTINTIRQYYNISLEPEQTVPIVGQEKGVKFGITDENLRTGSTIDKFRASIDAIRLLQRIGNEGRTSARPDEQVILCKDV